VKAHKVVSYEEWLKARKKHLKNEKALTRMRDMLTRERRELPWVKVEKDYVFDTAEGRRSLADLFGRNSQLIVQHFMWRHDLDQGCEGCSLHTDHAQGARVHLTNHDVSFVVVARAPLEKLLAYGARLGWDTAWASSLDSDFNYDFHVSFTPEQLDSGKVYYNYEDIPTEQAFDELPGLSVFYKNDDGQVFHTYSSYARGNEDAISTFHYLDLTPKGRNESEIMDWVKRNDEYEALTGASCCSAKPAAKSA